MVSDAFYEYMIASALSVFDMQIFNRNVFSTFWVQQFHFRTFFANRT